MLTMSHLNQINQLSNLTQSNLFLIFVMISFYTGFGLVMYLLIKSAYKKGNK